MFLNVVKTVSDPRSKLLFLADSTAIVVQDADKVCGDYCDF